MGASGLKGGCAHVEGEPAQGGRSCHRSARGVAGGRGGGAARCSAPAACCGQARAGAVRPVAGAGLCWPACPHTLQVLYDTVERLTGVPTTFPCLTAMRLLLDVDLADSRPHGAAGARRRARAAEHGCGALPDSPSPTGP